MINVKAQTCIDKDCYKIPIYNYENQSMGLYCGYHKKPNMIDVKNKKCIHPLCVKIPSYNYEGETKRLYCKSHKFLVRALTVASSSEHRHFKHGAVIVKRRKVLSEGSNKYTTNFTRSLHAEESALRASKENTRGSVMYIARVASYGQALSKPCLRCQVVLRNAGIKRVVYTSVSGTEAMLL